MKILCIIPARSGSKGIIDKNIRNFKDKPLLAWSILQAKESKYINSMRIVLSTDSEKYKNIGYQYGAEVPFLRPLDISGDLSTDFEFIKHCIIYLENNENYVPDIILQLRPTSPLRKTEDIDKAIDFFLENYDMYDSLRSVIEIEKTPVKMYYINNNILVPYFNEFNGIIEPYNNARQLFPKTYLHNGYIDIIKYDTIKFGSVSGSRILPFIMNSNDTLDIDVEKDLVQ